MAGIIGYGVAIPRKRIDPRLIAKVWPLSGTTAGVKEKSVAGEDEDGLTLAVEASNNALKHAGLKASDIGAVYMGTVSSPYVDKSAAMLIAEVLGMSTGVLIADFGGSTKAGTTALLRGADLISTKKVKFVLVIGADCQVGEMGSPLETAYGAGAVAYILSAEGGIAGVGTEATFATQFTTTWRSCGCEEVTYYDDARLHRSAGYFPHMKKAVTNLLKQMQVKPEEVSYLAFSQPDGKIPADLAKSLKFNPESMAQTLLATTLGDTGSASALLALAAALDSAKAQEKILVASYGSGAGSDAFLVTAGADIEAKRACGTPLQGYLEAGFKENIDYIRYEKIRRRLKSQPLYEPTSAYEASPPMWRDDHFILGLTALKCTKCGSINFPRRNICVEKDCYSRQFEEVPLPRQGVIETFYHQFVVYLEPEEGPFPICVARMAGNPGEYGGKVNSMMIDSPFESVKVGAPVELVFRRCGSENGMVKYGYKFRIINGEGGATNGAR